MEEIVCRAATAELLVGGHSRLLQQSRLGSSEAIRELSARVARAIELTLRLAKANVLARLTMTWIQRIRLAVTRQKFDLIAVKVDQLHGDFVREALTLVEREELDVVVA